MKESDFTVIDDISKWLVTQQCVVGFRGADKRRKTGNVLAVVGRSGSKIFNSGVQGLWEKK